MAVHRKSFLYTFSICLLAVLFPVLICEDENGNDEIIRGDGDPGISTATKATNDGQQHIWIPTLSTESSDAKLTTQPNVSENSVSNTPEKHSTTSKGNVVCLDQKPLRYKHDVLLKLKATSTCEETKAKILSILEHLCGEDCNLEIYQRDNTDEIIVYGDSIDADPEGMAGKFNNDNITDKVEVEEAVSRDGQGSKIILISLLIAGLLLAALLIAGYLLKIHRSQSKGLRLAEDSFQVDQENQGNTLLSVAPLPQQETVDKPIINGESQDSPPTNGHSAPQTQVADTPM